MLGPPKSRQLDRSVLVSLDTLVPNNHFYRHLHAQPDLSFVREWVTASYAHRGRPWVEPLFAEAKQWHGLTQFRLRELHNVNMHGLLVASGQNLKRYLAARGWGRRLGPTGNFGFPAQTSVPLSVR